MEAIAKTLKKNIQNEINSQSRELDCKVCPKCGEPLQKKIKMLGKEMLVPVMCKCRREEAKKRELEQQNVEKQTRLKKIINNSLMDKKFRTCTFENWDFQKGNRKMHNIGTKYADKFQEMKQKSIGLLIYGKPGNGKTHTTACIANNLIAKMVPVICVSINALLERIKQTYNTWGKEGEETVLRSLANADLLIIDDLGTEQNTDWSRTRVYNIIDNRYRNGLPLIITTNLTLTELENRYEKRTYDRILEMCTPVLNEGSSIRVEKAKEKTKILKEILN